MKKRPMRCVLPALVLLLSLAACGEKYASATDILCAPGEDALELCLQIIKEQGGGRK